MPRETRTTGGVSGSGAKKTHWPLVQASRHRPARSAAAYSCGRPLVQSPDTGFQPAPIPAAVDSRPLKGAALLVFPSGPIAAVDSRQQRESAHRIWG